MRGHWGLGIRVEGLEVGVWGEVLLRLRVLGGREAKEGLMWLLSNEFGTYNTVKARFWP